MPFNGILTQKGVKRYLELRLEIKKKIYYDSLTKIDKRKN